jgi:hypothetical protein
MIFPRAMVIEGCHARIIASVLTARAFIIEESGLRQ